MALIVIVAALFAWGVMFALCRISARGGGSPRPHSCALYGLALLSLIAASLALAWGHRSLAERWAWIVFGSLAFALGFELWHATISGRRRSKGGRNE